MKNEQNNGLTRGDLARLTGVNYGLIGYYLSCGYLPVIRASSGHGVPTLFDPSAVDVIQERMALRGQPARLNDAEGFIDGQSE